eukprot:286054-Pyramimonas_sp.AAC.1
MAHKALKGAPRGGQEAPRCPQGAPRMPRRCFQDTYTQKAPRGTQDAPRGLGENANITDGI